MNDPRENCPWKCKQCLCYAGEIERLSAENGELLDFVKRIRQGGTMMDVLTLQADVKAWMDPASTVRSTCCGDASHGCMVTEDKQ